MQRTKYVEGCVFVLDSSEVLPIFGVIINILLIKSDEPYFVCELLQTEYTSTVLSSKKTNQFPYIVFSINHMNDHHTLGLYSLRLNQNTIPTHFIVPQYHLM